MSTSNFEAESQMAQGENRERGGAPAGRPGTAPTPASPPVGTGDQRFSLLLEAGSVLGSSVDVDTSLTRLAQLLVPGLADWCMIHRLDGWDGFRLAAAAPDDIEERLPTIFAAAAGTIAGEAGPTRPKGIRASTSELQPRIGDEFLAVLIRDRDHATREFLRSLELTSCMIVPLRGRTGMLGRITLVTGPSGRQFDAHDLALAEEVARQAALTVEAAQLRSENHSLRARCQHSEARFRRVVDANLFGVVFADAEGRLLDANGEFLRMCGYSGEELAGGTLHWMDLTAPRFRSRDHRAAQQMLSSGVATPYETELVRKDGATIPILISAALFEGTAEGIAFVMDLTPQKRAQEALHYAMEHAHCLLWHAHVEAPAPGQRAYRWDLHLFDESAANRFLPLEMEPGESFAAAFYRCKPPDDQKRANRNARHAFETGQNRYTQEYRCRRADGELRWLVEETYLEPAGPGRWRAVGICTDITERKRMEDELRAQTRALSEADRRKDEFLAMLAHELRNPLGAISNAVTLLREPRGGAPARARALEVLQRQVEHQRRMVDDLLDVSRITRGSVELHRTPLDLRRLLEDATADHGPLLERADLSLRVGLPDGAVWVEGDPTRLAQVLSNLLTNSAKFTDPGGEITLSLHVERGAEAVIRVRDTGVGIAPELLPLVFDPFTQGDRSLDRSRGGLGLGLALVQGLVELHHGSITAESDGPGRGATFTIRLPLRAHGGETPASATAGPPPSAGKRVLVIEDNRDAAETLRDLLDLYGHTVELAGTGQAGLEAARRICPDVVLCDIGLPGMDGYEVARQLRAELAGPTAGERTPPLLIALTGYGHDDDRRRSREAGFAHHLVKPVDLDELRRLLGDSSL